MTAEAVVVIAVVLVVVAIALARRPRARWSGARVQGVRAHGHDQAEQQWRALIRPIRFESPVGYALLVRSIRECVGAGTAGSSHLVRRELDSQTTSYAFVTAGWSGFQATVVCEPDGMGSRGRLEVRAVEGAADAAVVGALVRLRDRVVEGVHRVGGRLRDGG